MHLSIILILTQVLSILALKIITYQKAHCDGPKLGHEKVAYNETFDDRFLSYRLSRAVKDSSQLTIGSTIADNEGKGKGCHNLNSEAQGFVLMNSASALGRPDLIVVLGVGVGALVFMLFL